MSNNYRNNIFNGAGTYFKKLLLQFDITPTKFFSIASYFSFLKAIFQRKTCSVIDSADPLSCSLSIFKAHGYTPILSDPHSSYNTNHEIQSDPLFHLAESTMHVFCSALSYYIKRLKNITKFPLPSTQPCLFLSDPTSSSSFLNVDIFHKPLSSWITAVKPFCCDLHDVDAIIQDESQSLSSSVDYLSQYLPPFAHLLNVILAERCNTSFLPLFSPSGSKEIVMTCLSNLIVTVRSLGKKTQIDVLKNMIAFQNVDKYPAYFFTFAANLLADVVDYNPVKLESIKNLYFNSSMLDIVVDAEFCNLVNDTVANTLASSVNPPLEPEISPTEVKKQKAKQPVITPPVQLSKKKKKKNKNSKKVEPKAITCVRVEYLSDCDDSNPVFQEFADFVEENSKLVEPTDRLLVVVTSVVKLVDSVVLIFKKFVLRIVVTIDFKLPNSIVQLFESNQVFKYWFSSQCSLLDFGQLFSLSCLNSFIDVTDTVRQALPSFLNFATPETDTAPIKADLTKLFQKHSISKQYLGELNHVAFAAVLDKICRKNRYHTIIEPSSILIEQSSISPKVSALLSRQSAINKLSQWTFIDYSINVNADDVIYSSSVVNLMVVDNTTKNYPSLQRLCIEFFVPQHCGEDSVNAFSFFVDYKLLNVVVKTKPLCLIFKIENLTEFFILERLLLNDSMFDSRFHLSFETFPNQFSFGLDHLNSKHKNKKYSEKNEVIIHSPFSSLFQLINLIPSCYSCFFPHLSNWNISTDKCSFTLPSFDKRQLSLLVSLMGLTQLISIGSNESVFDNKMIHSSMINSCLESEVKRFLHNHNDQFPNDLISRGFNESFENLHKVQLSPEVFLKLACSFTSSFGSVNVWKFGCEFGHLSPVFRQMERVVVLMNENVCSDGFSTDKSSNLVEQFIVFLFDNNLFSGDYESSIVEYREMFLAGAL
ncbi:hypothetical protein GEMRC1_005782 [Eukaryota sp. GEM-RC1]